MEPKRGLLWAGIGALSLSALGAISIFLFGTFGELESKLLLTTFTIGWYSMCSAATFGFRNEKNSKVITGFGVSVAVIGIILTLYQIWRFLGFDDFGDKVRMPLAFLIASFSLAHASVLLKMISDSVWATRIALATVCIIVIIAGMLTHLIFSENFDFPEFYFRLLASLVVLDLLGTVLVPIVKKLTAKKSGGEHA